MRPVGPVVSSQPSVTVKELVQSMGGFLGEGLSVSQSTGTLSLVAPPFNSVKRPSIQIGLLAELSRTAGWVCHTHHLFLDFAMMVGMDVYEAIANNRGVATGDWLFSQQAFGHDAPDPSGEHFLRDLKPGSESVLRKVREKVVPEFVRLAADEVLRKQPDVVGFTSTFQQTVAGIAIARRIKELAPAVRTIFGGANFEWEMAMEWVGKVPAIDFALSGEADRTLPLFLKMVAEKTAPTGVPGLTWKNSQGMAEQSTAAPLVTDLQNNPTPDYSEYFDRAKYLGIIGKNLRNDIRLPFESARGCWWGEKQHCTFCGLNALSMKFRSKTPDRVLTELAELSERHSSYHFEAVDNIIDHTYSKTLLPKLCEPTNTYDLFYEVKSNLKPRDLRDMSLAGIKTIQPGIESLSTPVLKLMRKGVRGIHNINVLRWARYYGVTVSWNVLWGFPGEKEAYYREQAAVFDSLHHLQPPSAGVRIWLERFSPLYKDTQTFPMEYRRPEASLAYILPNYIDKESIAYFFDYKVDDALPDDAFKSTEQAIERWRSTWEGDGHIPSLDYFSGGYSVLIEDRRSTEDAQALRLKGSEAKVFMAIVEKPLAIDRIADLTGIPENRVARAARVLAADGLIVQEQELCLALPLPFRR